MSEENEESQSVARVSNIVLRVSSSLVASRRIHSILYSARNIILRSLGPLLSLPPTILSAVIRYIDSGMPIRMCITVFTNTIYNIHIHVLRNRREKTSWEDHSSLRVDADAIRKAFLWPAALSAHKQRGSNSVSDTMCTYRKRERESQMPFGPVRTRYICIYRYALATFDSTASYR